MASRRKAGGRRKGTRIKATREVTELCANKSQPPFGQARLEVVTPQGPLDRLPVRRLVMAGVWVSGSRASQRGRRGVIRNGPAWNLKFNLMVSADCEPT
jgi:hypothetical protein